MKITEIVTEVNTSRGAPMGRPNVGKQPIQTKVYDKRVRLDSGGYDIGGAYWGIGNELRVRFTKDLSYVEYYRI